MADNEEDLVDYDEEEEEQNVAAEEAADAEGKEPFLDCGFVALEYTEGNVGPILQETYDDQLNINTTECNS
eukprot:scaffold31709_cov160-Skeletonema_menzelii.AAC.2